MSLLPRLLSQDYELQLMTYRAFVESQQKSPMKRRRMLSSSDAITQEVGARPPARPRQGGKKWRGEGGNSSTPSKPPSSLCEMSSFLLNSRV